MWNYIALKKEECLHLGILFLFRRWLRVYYIATENIAHR